MISLISIILLGFFLGMRHATDADHVVAVTTIVSRERTVRHAAWLGALWGLGHTLTIVVVGGAIVLLNVVIPPRVELLMEMSVGVMLVGLGLLNLSGTMRRTGASHALEHSKVVHHHAHSHGDYVHSHPHGHEPEGHPHRPDDTPLARLDRSFHRRRLYRLVRPLVIGVVHGLAGSAAVALLVLTTIREPFWGLLYLLVFGVGTVAGMMLVTAAIAVPFAYAGRRFAPAHRRLQIATGVLSVGFGLVLAYQIGFKDGLF